MLMGILLGNRNICRDKSSKDMWVLEDKVELIGVYGYRVVENVNIIVI